MKHTSYLALLYLKYCKRHPFTQVTAKVLRMAIHIPDSGSKKGISRVDFLKQRLDGEHDDKMVK